MGSAAAYAARRSGWAAKTRSSIGVWTVPGQIALTRTPLPATSSAAALVSPITPWLEAHGHAELLPDRVEMRRVRKRRRSGNVECKATN